MALALLAAASSSSRQQASVSLQGLTVYAINGEALPGTTVTLSRDGRRAAETHTTRNGSYQFSDLSAGDYSVTFSLPGFIEVSCNVQINPGRTASAIGALALNGFDVGEPGPSDERRRLCFVDGEVPVFLEYANADRRGSVLILVADVGRAPRAAAQFLKQVDASAFDKGTIRRIPTPPMQGAAGRAPRDPSGATSVIEVRLPPATGAPLQTASLETTRVSGLSHRAGTLTVPQAVAGAAGVPAFLIMLEDDPSFDAGGGRYVNREGAAAFGRVAMRVAGLKGLESAPFTIVSIKRAGWEQRR
jgi:cyclophilin family peptidyl-prolyl cis-trans isomerase